MDYLFFFLGETPQQHRQKWRIPKIKIRIIIHWTNIAKTGTVKPATVGPYLKIVDAATTRSNTRHLPPFHWRSARNAMIMSVWPVPASFCPKKSSQHTHHDGCDECDV
jgi:hypothetical protein